MRKLAGLIVAVILVAAFLGVWYSSQNRASTLPVPAAAAAAASPPLSAPSSPIPSPAPSMTAPPTQTPARPEPSVTAQPASPPVALPTKIRIPAIGVDTGFEYVGLTPDGAMDVPKNPTQVAWYKLGPKPGERGNAVIAGHVDWGGKLMPFWGLKDLKPGDTVTVTAADGHEYQFAVQWSKSYDADNAPVKEIFGQSTSTEVTLITCGGTFDHTSHSYPSRLVVRAALR